MSDDDVQIDHGGSVAVDTDVLRDIRQRLASVSRLVDQAGAAARRAYAEVVEGAGLSRWVDTVQLWATADVAAAVVDRIEEVVMGIGLMADAFELVELRAERAAIAISGSAEAQHLDARIAVVRERDSRLAEMAVFLEAGWKQERFEGLHGQMAMLDLFGVNGGVLTTGALLLGASPLFGTVASGQSLQGTPDRVTVRPVATSMPVAPPAGLADALRRFPHKDAAHKPQLKVEKYTFPDGSRRFVLYALGTKSGWLGGKNPWDMRSNIQLYASQASGSYQATVDALHEAGAGPGDTVDVYAHSQGAMIASHLAMDSEFDVDLVVTAGNPVEPMLRDDQLSIQLRHSDDIVNALSGGGGTGGIGSPDSFIAHRVGDPEAGWQDVLFEPHRMEQYVETAEQVDRSGDPRVEVYRQKLAELAEADTIEATEFRADRVE